MTPTTGSSAAGILDLNLRALREAGIVVEQGSGDRLRRSDLRFGTTRDGEHNVGIEIDGRVRWFHSTYSAMRESDRLLAQVPLPATVLVVGIGAGHHIKRGVERGNRVLVFEPDDDLLRAGLLSVDLSREIQSGRLVLVGHARESAVESEIASAYLPLFDGPIVTLALASWVAACGKDGEAALKRVEDALHELRADLAVQARHGGRWFRNTLLNLPRAAQTQPGPLTSLQNTTCYIAAAGPTLNPDRLGRPLISVDSALPILSAYGVRADIAVSIDCQIASYHHILGSRRETPPLVADIASAPSVFYEARNLVPAFTAHPLHQLLRLLGMRAITLDTRGGSVTHAALDLATQLRPDRIEVHGADFSYPGGETYARGSYIHRALERAASRMRPTEGAHYHFLRSRPGVRRLHGTNDWSQPGLVTFLDRFDAMSAAIGIPVVRVDGESDGRLTAARRPFPEIHTASSPTSAEASDHAAPSATASSVVIRLYELIESMASESALRRALASGGIHAQAARSLLPTLVWASAQARGEQLAYETIHADICVMIRDSIDRLKS